MAKTVILEVQIDGVNRSLNTIDDLKQAIIDTKKELGSKAFGTEAFTRLNNTLGALESTMTDVRNVTKQAGQNFTISADQGKNSYRAMSTELNKLRTIFRQLSETERNSNIGKSLTTQIQKLDRELKKIDGDLGQFQRNVGNYKQGIAGFADILSGGLISGGTAAVATFAIQGISKGLREGVEAIKEYDAALKDLSAILGLTGDDLKEFEDAANSLQVIEVGGQKIVTAGKDILQAFKLIGSAKPELLEDEEALKAVAKAAIVLNQSMGGPLEGTVKAITTVLGQFGLEASKADEIVNTLAAASKEGNAEVGDIADTIQRMGKVAQLSGLSLAETAAALEVIAKGEIKGERAASAFQQTLLKLDNAAKLPNIAQDSFKKYGVNVQILQNTLLPFSVRLKELQKIQGDVTAANNIFGESATAVAAILANSNDQFDGLLPKVQGTIQAYDQAAIKAASLTQKQTNLNNAITNFLTSTSTGIGDGLSFALEVLTGVLIELGKEIEPLKKEFGELGKAVGDFAKAIGINTEDVNIFRLAVDAIMFSINNGIRVVTFFTDAFTGLFNALNNVIERIPFLGGGIERLNALLEKLTGSNNKAIKEALKNEADYIERISGQVTKTAEVDKILEANKRKAELRAIEEEERLKRESAAVKRASEIKKQAAEQEKKRIDDLKAARKDDPLLGSLENIATTAQRADDEIKELESEIRAFKDVLSSTTNPKVFRVAEDALIELERRLRVVRDLVAAGVSPDQSGIKILNDLAKGAAATDIARAQNVADAIKKLKVESNKETQDQINEDNEKADLEQEEGRKRLKESIVQAAGLIASAVTKIESNNLESRLNEQLSALDKESQKKIELAGGDESKIAIIEAQAEKKRKALELDAAKRRKGIALKEAAIQGALGIIASIKGGLPEILLAIATLAANIAVITSTQFAKGGKVKVNEKIKLGFEQGRSHAQGGNKHSFGETERGEFMDLDEHGNLNIINKKSSSKFRRQLQSVAGLSFSGKGKLLSDINSYSGFGKRYELGGVAPAFVRVQSQQSSQTLEVNLSKNDIRALAVETGKEVKKGSREGTETGANNAINQNKRRDQARQRSIL